MTKVLETFNSSNRMTCSPDRETRCRKPCYGNTPWLIFMPYVPDTLDCCPSLECAEDLPASFLSLRGGPSLLGSVPAIARSRSPPDEQGVGVYTFCLNGRSVLKQKERSPNMPPRKGKAKFEWIRLPAGKPGKGPKLGKPLRHDIKRLFHDLYERTLLLKEIDPSFAQEMTRLGLDKPFALVAKAIAVDKERR
jgi:hypothetical protein